MRIDELPGVLKTFLHEVPTLGLATVDDSGRPHAANVNFCADEELNLFFLSSPDSAHARHVAARPQVAATAYAPFERPDQIRGVQVHGTCAVLPDSEFDATWALFRARFPYAAQFERRAREEESFYRFRPDWVRWIDNSVHFGFKVASAWPVRDV